MKIFVTSDLHFFHGNIIEYCKRPFSNVEVMNECLIENWNSKINKEDLVIYCGDFALCTADKFDETIKRLNGRKILVKGNHDTRSDLFYLDNDRFSFVCRYFAMKNILFTHRPLAYNEPCSEQINVHGHTHNNSGSSNPRRYTENNKALFNVSVEMTEYFPVTIDEIIERCGL